MKTTRCSGPPCISNICMKRSAAWQEGMQCCYPAHNVHLADWSVAYGFWWQGGGRSAAYLLEQPVCIVDFVFLALPLIAQGLNIAQRCEPSKQVGIRRAPIWPSASKLDAVQLKVPGSSKLVSEQLFQLFHPRRVSKLLWNWNILCTPPRTLRGQTIMCLRSVMCSSLERQPMSHRISVHPVLTTAVRGGFCMSHRIRFPTQQHKKLT